PLEAVMTFQGVFLLAWAAILVTDAVIVKKVLKISPGYYEWRQINLFKWNPVGVVSLLVSSIVGTIAALGYMRSFLQSTAAFLATKPASNLKVVIPLISKGKYYIKKESNDISKEEYVA